MFTEGYAIYDQCILEDLKTNNKMVIFSTKRPQNGGPCLRNSKISNDKKYVAVIEDNGKLWIYNIENKSLKKIHEQFSGRLSWSFNNRFLGIFQWDKALLIDIDNPETTFEIIGKSFSWTEEENIILENNNNIYAYDLNSKKTELIIENASKAVFLLKDE